MNTQVCGICILVCGLWGMCVLCVYVCVVWCVYVCDICVVCVCGVCGVCVCVLLPNRVSSRQHLGNCKCEGSTHGSYYHTSGADKVLAFPL